MFGRSFWIQFVFLLLGIGLLWTAFRNQDWEALGAQLQHADYRWGLPILLTTLLNHWLRARRWELLIATLPMPTRTTRTLSALLVGYLVSFAVPRLGEVTRCGLLSEKKTDHFTRLIGTVVVERSIDVLCLLLIGLLAFGLETERLYLFAHSYFWEPLTQLELSGKWLPFLLLFFVLLAVVWGVWRLLPRLGHYLRGFLQGLDSIRKLASRWLFVGYTLLIWLCYFGMTYLWFFAFSGTETLSVSAGITLLFVGGVARSLPIQGGGMGVYHLLFSEAVAVFGASLLTGKALAVVVHGFQSLFYILGGGLAWLYLLFSREQKKEL